MLPQANILARSNSCPPGRFSVKPLITAIAPLDEGPQWFERLYAREPNLMKVVLTPEPMTETPAQIGLFDLTGRVAIVTGTSRGLGQHIRARPRARRRRSRPHQPHPRLSRAV